MSEKNSPLSKENLKKFFGIEPRPPVGGHAEPRSATDTRHMVAFLASVLAITLLAIAVVQFDLFSFQFRDIPLEDQVPGRQVITPVPTIPN